jgi:hypothetical protein
MKNVTYVFEYTGKKNMDNVVVSVEGNNYKECFSKAWEELCNRVEYPAKWTYTVK